MVERVGHAVAGLVAIVVLGCAGAETGARVGDDGAPSVTSEPAPNGSAENAPPAVEPSRELLAPVLQAAIDAPQLEPYWHVAERPERSPLVLARTPMLEGEPKLVKFGKAVEYATRDKLGDKPHIEVQSLSIKPDRATVVLAYTAEGIVARVDLVREVGAWVVAEAQVVEH